MAANSFYRKTNMQSTLFDTYVVFIFTRSYKNSSLQMVFFLVYLEPISLNDKIIS